MAKREKTGRIDVEGSSSPLEVSLGALLGKEEAPERTGKEMKNDDPGPRQKKGTLPGRVILSRETKGRGGKTVTAVSFREGVPDDPEGLAKQLRTALGCGGALEDGRIILQGDQVERASAWFAAKGVKPTKGN
ncbi:MAG: translation initiation factor [Aminobacteriaceae bacterium]|jgi:translation initiation factor 1